MLCDRLPVSRRQIFLGKLLGRMPSTGFAGANRLLQRQWRQVVAEHGLDGRLASVRALEQPLADITQAKEEARERLVALCLEAVENDDAEVIVLGGGPIAGLAAEVERRQPQVANTWPKSSRLRGIPQWLAGSKKPASTTVVLAAKRSVSSPAPRSFPCRRFATRRRG